MAQAERLQPHTVPGQDDRLGAAHGPEARRPYPKEAPVAVTKDMLLSELQDLLRLTAFEQTIVTVRHSLAVGEILADEQAHKARKGVVQALEERLQELSSTV